MATTEVKRDFRRRLLDGLAQSIREKGLQGTQISDVVRNASTSRRTFYECFADKEACFGELIQEWMKDLLEGVRAVVDPEADWEQQIDASVDTYLAALGDDPALTVTVTRELPMLGSLGVKLQEQDIDNYADLLVDMTRTPGMRRAGVDPVDMETAVMVIGGFAEVVDRATRDGKAPASVSETVKQVIKRVIGPRQRADR
jgi:AcrR family transcriptional regulator